MKIFIMTDIEGVALITTWEEVLNEGPLKTAAMRRATGEVNAAVEGILDYDKNAEIYVIDGHGPGGLLKDELHEKTRILSSGFGAPWLLDDSFDGYFFIGQHAMAGTPGGVLAHTYSSKSIVHYKLNGRVIGEFGCRAIMAGNFKVPALFISGDDKAVKEAEAMVPGIIGAPVKTGYGKYKAVSLSATAARKLIRARAAEACSRAQDIKPVNIPGPYELEIRYHEDIDLSGRRRRGQEMLDDHTVVLRADDICSLPI